MRQETYRLWQRCFLLERWHTLFSKERGSSLEVYIFPKSVIGLKCVVHKRKHRSLSKCFSQESQALLLSSALAQRAIAWRPRLSVAAAVSLTATWYRAQRAGEDVLQLCQQQIEHYQNLLRDNRDGPP